MPATAKNTPNPSKLLSDRKFLVKFLDEFVMGAIAEGHIDPRGKSREQLLKELRSFVSSGDISVRLDHTWDLLTEARAQSRKERPHLAILIYATWFEHWLNGVVHRFARKGGLAEQEAVLAIRETSIRAKLTWMLRLLKLPPIAKKHALLLLMLTDHRNAFVHYKWSIAPDPRDDGHRKERERILGEIEKTVKYLLEYERKHVYLGKKPRVSRMPRDG